MKLNWKEYFKEQELGKNSQAAREVLRFLYGKGFSVQDAVEIFAMTLSSTVSIYSVQESKKTSSAEFGEKFIKEFYDEAHDASSTGYRKLLDTYKKPVLGFSATMFHIQQSTRLVAGRNFSRHPALPGQGRPPGAGGHL